VRSDRWHVSDPSFQPFVEAGDGTRFVRGQGLVGRAWQLRRPLWNRDVTTDPTFTRSDAAARAGLHAGVVVPVLAGDEVAAVLDFFVSDLRSQDERFMELASTVSSQLATVILRRRAEQQVAAMAERFHDLAMHDETTGLLNRRGFLSMAEHHVAIAERELKTVTLLFIDLDKMKTINDLYGHPEGDRALIDAAAILRTGSRDADVVGRVGGDEFCVFVDGGEDAEGAIRTRVEELLAAHNGTAGRPYQLSLSVGSVTRRPGEKADLHEMMALADKAMYSAKAAPEPREAARATERFSV
jgi:diguanylate cyclase (GGDEF)-like protein